MDRADAPPYGPWHEHLLRHPRRPDALLRRSRGAARRAPRARAFRRPPRRARRRLAQARVAARWALAEVPLARFLAEPVIPYETDDVTRLIMDSHDTAAFAPGLGPHGGGVARMAAVGRGERSDTRRTRPRTDPEMVAAVSKLMGNADLVAVARKVQVVTAFRSTIGLRAAWPPASSPTTPPTTPRAWRRPC